MSQRKKPRRFEVGLKQEAVRRMMAGESPSALSRELGVLRKDLYRWKDSYRQGEPLKKKPGPKAEPGAAMGGSALDKARRRIADLERKVGQQALELDFFEKALRWIEGAETGKPSAPSTSSSRRKPRKAN